MTVHRKLDSFAPLCWLAIVGCVGLQAWRYAPFIADDTFISLRYADRWLHGHGLTWSDDQVVEGYSNLLFVLIVSLFGALGVDLVVAARAVGIASMIGVAAAVAWPLRHQASPLPAAVAWAMLAVSPPVVVWAIGGLESALFMALTTWAAVLCLDEFDGPRRGRDMAIGGLLGALCLTRADGFVMVGGLGVAWLAAGPSRFRDRLRRFVTPVLAAALAVAGQTAFRVLYYGDWVPNTFYAKVALNGQRLAEGAGYVWHALSPFALLVVVAAGAAVAGARRAQLATRRLSFLLMAGAAWAAYVVVIGGDVFPSYRHALPALALLVLAVSEALRWDDGMGGRALTAVTLPAVAVALLVSGYLQHRDPANQRAKEERWEAEGRFTGEQVGALLSGRDVTLALTAAGSVGYYARLPRLLDMYGLNDRYLTRHRPEGFGHGQIGHEAVDNAYVLSRQPDAIVFHVGDRHPWMGFDQDPVFVANYQPRALTPNPETGIAPVIWLRRGSPAVRDLIEAPAQ